MRLVYVTLVILLALMTSGPFQTIMLGGSSEDRTNGWTKEIHNCRFAFEKWGTYNCMDIDGKRYFAGYSSQLNEKMREVGLNTPCLWERSGEKNLLPKGRVSEVLIDENSEGTLSYNTPNVLSLELKEGFQLHLRKTEDDGSRVYVELTKDGEVVDRKVVPSSSDYLNPDLVNENTYCYRTNLGESKNIVQIAAHFKNAFKIGEGGIATYEGVFQISESPIDLIKPPLEIQTVREYDKDGKLLWEVEGYRYEGDQKYNVVNRSGGHADPNGFLRYFLYGMTYVNNPELNKPICIINDGYKLVLHGKFKSWINNLGVWDTPVVEGEYKNGLKQGRWNFWYQGELASISIPAQKGAEGEYFEGVKEGHWKYYDFDCRNMVARESDYLNGIEQESTVIETEYKWDTELKKCVPGKVDPRPFDLVAQ